MACKPEIAKAIAEHDADYLLAVKTIHREIDKGHGRIEERTCHVSCQVAWMSGDRRFPGEYRFPKLAAIAMIEAKVETKTKAWTERRYYISSRALAAEQLAEAVRTH
jgi:hypothetical protein